MQETLPQKDSRSTVQKESLFAFAGLTSVAVLHRTELLSLAPAKWATISGWLLLLAGVWIASALDRRFEQMLRRLYQREAIARSSDKALLRTDFEQWLGRVRSRAHAAGLAGSIVFPAMLLVAYACVYLGERLNAMDTMERVWFIAEVTIELICARMVGRTIGRGISYGFLGKHLASDQVQLNVIPGHSDNTAGLRPIGDFYFYQATVTALPVVFFAFWILMMPAWTTIAPGVHPELSDQFSVQWKNTYLVFLFVALGIEVLAFLLPLWFFHREMATQKKGPSVARRRTECITVQVATRDDDAFAFAR